MATTYVSIKELKELGQTQTVGTENKKTLLIPTGQDTTDSTNKTISSEGVLASILDPMSAPISTTYKALPFNPLQGRAVVANSTNTKAYGVRPVDMGQESVAIELAGEKFSETPKATGFNANAITLNFSFQHKTPTVGTARVMANLRLKTDLSLVRPMLTLTGNSLVITGWATIADDTIIGVTLATRTLVVGRTYNYSLCYGGNTGSGLGTVKLYENGILIYSNAITYHSEYIASLLAGVAFRPQLEGNWLTNRIFNYTCLESDVAYYWNNGRPDLAIIRDRDKWGSKTKYNSTYAGNEVLDAVGWYKGNTTALMPVGLKRPNAIGLYDMSGNVWGWCWDFYGGTYPTGANNPTGIISGSSRVSRGGSWSVSDNLCRVTIRGSSNPDYNYSDIGFRLCRKYSETLLTNDVVVQAKTAGMQAIGSGTYTDCTIDSFLMQKYVVTVQEFSGTGTDTKPKVSINWYNACKYANEKSSANGLEKCYHVEENYNENSWGDTPAIECDFNKSGYRLPTEAEWEWAARQGSAGSVADYSPASIADPITTGIDLSSITAGNTYEVYTTALNSADITGGVSPTGATDTAIGTRFVAIRTGALTGSGKVRLVAVTAWDDNSTNVLNATVSGNPMLVKTQVETTQGQGIANSIRVNNTVSQATASPTIVIDPGRVPEFFSVKNNHSSSSMTIKLGTSAGASDVCTETTITAGKTKSIPCSVIEIDESASKTLYVTATTVTTYDTTLTTRGAR